MVRGVFEKKTMTWTENHYKVLLINVNKYDF